MKKINLKLETIKPHFFYKKWEGKIGANQQLHFTQSWWRPVSSPSWADNCKICDIYTMIISCLIINLCHFSIWPNNVDNYFLDRKKKESLLWKIGSIWFSICIFLIYMYTWTCILQQFTVKYIASLYSWTRPGPIPFETISIKNILIHIPRVNYAFIYLVIT